MIKEYRKKTTIKAERFNGSEEMIGRYHIWNVATPGKTWYTLETLEGPMKLQLGDWIATGIDGEHWAIADDIFRRTYEEVVTNED